MLNTYQSDLKSITLVSHLDHTQPNDGAVSISTNKIFAGVAGIQSPLCYWLRYEQSTYKSRDCAPLETVEPGLFLLSLQCCHVILMRGLLCCQCRDSACYRGIQCGDCIRLFGSYCLAAIQFRVGIDQVEFCLRQIL